MLNTGQLDHELMALFSMAREKAFSAVGVGRVLLQSPTQTFILKLDESSPIGVSHEYATEAANIALQRLGEAPSN